MTLMEKKAQYQAILNTEFKKENMELVEGKTEEEISLLNPLSYYDFLGLAYTELISLQTKWQGLEKEINEDEENLKRNVRSDIISELHSDILNNRIKERMIEQEIVSLENLLQEVKEEEYGTKNSR